MAKATVAMGARVAVTAGATITATRTHDHTGETIRIAMTTGDIEVVHTDPHGIEEGKMHGAMAPLHQTHMTAIGS